MILKTAAMGAFDRRAADSRGGGNPMECRSIPADNMCVSSNVTEGKARSDTNGADNAVKSLTASCADMRQPSVFNCGKDI